MSKRRGSLPKWATIVLTVFLVIFILFLILVFLLSSPSDTADEQAAGSTAPSSAEATALSDEEKTVVYDDDSISVEFDGATDGSAYGIQDTLYLSFTFTNKTDSELTIYPTDVVINNMSVTLASGIPSTMQANTSVANSFFVTFQNAGIGSVEEVKTVKLKFSDLSSYTSQDITIDVNQ